MKKLIKIILIGILFIGCGANSINEERDNTLPNISYEKECNQKGGCLDTDNDLSNDSTTDSSENENSSDNGNLEQCNNGEIKITDDDRDILDYNNPLIVYDMAYNIKNDTFCIRWKSFNEATLNRKIHYSYHKDSYNEFEENIIEVDKDKGFSITKLKDSVKYNKVYIKIYFGGYDNDLNQYVGYYTITKELKYQPKKNKAPIVNAGDDISAYLNEYVTLIGTASDSDGSISSYEWGKGSNVLGTTKILKYIPTELGVETLTFTVVDNDGLSSSDTVNITVIAKVIELTEKEKILTETNNLSFGYYKDKNEERWFISGLDNYKAKTLYSLMPIKNGSAGWGIVAKNIAKVDLEKETVTIGDIPKNTDSEYSIRYGSKLETITSDRFQSDIEKIRNSTVAIKWWFFNVDNSWFIINKKGNVYQFSYKNVTKDASTTQEYDWQKIDLDGALPTFFVEDGVKKFRF